MISAVQVTILFLFAVVAIRNVYADDTEYDCDGGFENYKKEHGKGKNYGNQEEHKKRKEQYKKRCQEINEHNKRFNKKLETYQKGLNRFTDMDDNELSKFTGAFKPGDVKVQEIRSKRQGFPLPPTPLPPATLDYRTTGCLPPIKDQGPCGSCWAFATVAAFEFKHCNKTKNLTRFSEQQIVDCDRSNYGCDGGWPSNAIQYVINNNLATEASYPYTEATYPYTLSNGTCSYNPATKGLNFSSLSYGSVTAGSGADMANQLIKYGPVVVAFSAVRDFFFYKSGVYGNANCSSYRVNHAMLLVGYGYDPVGGPHWILRNSWSEGWGEKGYMRVRSTSNMCNVVSYGWYLKAE